MLKDQFITVQSAIICPPKKHLDRLLISVDREWCKQDEYSYLNKLFFKQTWNDGDPHQLIFYNSTLLRKENRFIISWAIQNHEYQQYYAGRYDIDNHFFKHNQNDFIILGYDVCTHLNASAFKFGLSPFNDCFGNLSMINHFGLFQNIEDANDCANFNTEYGYDHDWYVVKVLMHQHCFDFLINH